jgi:hypothetical protein
MKHDAIQTLMWRIVEDEDDEAKESNSRCAIFGAGVPPRSLLSILSLLSGSSLS